MTTEFCAYCGTHVPTATGERVGIIRFCGRSHVIEWYSLPAHDRRHAAHAVAWERRAS